ncbi:MAG: hypothetical protein JNJ54_13685 [Myxococcaceae bacterium]|nr:hypothetical protein [Myxococcaceae bacterium]
MRDVTWWRTTLKQALRDGLRARDASAVSLWRETLSAIEHAEAVDVAHAPRAEDGPIAGAVRGLGAAEVARRTLSPGDIEQVLRRELAERRGAADELARLGKAGEAARLRTQAALLERLLA